MVLRLLLTELACFTASWLSTLDYADTNTFLKTARPYEGRANLSNSFAPALTRVDANIPQDVGWRKFTVSCYQAVRLLGNQERLYVVVLGC